MRRIKNAATGKKATAWRNFSAYIRARDALATTGTLEYCKCITCGHVKPIAEMDAGHMIGGRRAGILFDESMVFAQCQTCNRTNGGEYQAFKREMISRNGEEWYAEKERQKREIVALTDEALVLISKLYLQKYKELTK
jgi:NAD-dependent SIR2 family protein deacetylase